MRKFFIKVLATCTAAIALCARAESGADFPQACGDLKSPFSAKVEMSKFEATAVSEAQKRPSEAETILEEASKKEWAGAAIFFLSGNLYYEKADYSKAIVQYKKSLEKAPTFFAARKNLGFTYALTENRDAAERELKIALALSGSSDVNILLWFCDARAAAGDWSSSLAFCNQALLYAPENMSARRAQAWLLQKAGRNAECVGVCNAALSEFPYDAQFWKIKIAAQIASEDLRGAESSIIAARALSLSDETSEIALARIYYKEGDFNKCAKLCDEILKSVKDERQKKDAVLMEATSLVKIGKYADAESVCAKYDSLGRDILTVRFEAAFANGDTKKAETFLRKILSQNSGDSYSAYRLAEILSTSEGGNLGEAEVLFNAAAKDPKLFTYANLGILRIRLNSGDDAGALEIAKKLLAIKASPELKEYTKILEQIVKKGADGNKKNTRE